MNRITLDLYGFPMECEYEYDKGGKPVFNDIYGGDPGWGPSVALASCEVGGVNVFEMLSSQQIERIEAAILNEVEFA